MMNKSPSNPTRRAFLKTTAMSAGAMALRPGALAAEAEAFKLNYILASCMYGTLSLEEILPEVGKSGADTIDIWPKVHGAQREQIDAMGRDAFLELLDQHKVELGILTRYDLGPYKLQPEIRVAKELGAKMVICASSKIKGETLKDQVAAFVEKIRPQIEAAEEAGVRIGIENHGNAVIHEPDSLRYFAELTAFSDAVGIAFAPYHLPQDEDLMAGLIRDIGPKLFHFYAWEHGMGCSKKLPKAQEMQQLPGYGSLDFRPILAALKEIRYRGWTSIFMHPVPRGIPILPTAEESTQAANRSREYLDHTLTQI